jgi:transcriptional regulator with XRE-family HTH domain
MPKPPPSPVDSLIGKRIRLRRKELGLVQIDIAEHMGVSTQAVQKWETGGAGLSARRLEGLADLLKIPVSGLIGEGEQFEGDAQRLALTKTEEAFIAALRKIDSHHIRRDLMRMVKAIAAECGGQQNDTQESDPL